MSCLPRRNRVTPFSQLIATPGRGDFMGNRGALHNAQGAIVRQFQGRRWIYCLLEFKGRRRAIMQPGRYTELFFLDEATALAAGHRPCAECMRPRFQAFCTAWAKANSLVGALALPRAAELDALLHAQRPGPAPVAGAHRARLADLPEGVVVVADGADASAGAPHTGVPLLWWQGALLTWTPLGYDHAAPGDPTQLITVLTPAATVATFRQGFRPTVHDSAMQALDVG